MPGDAMKKIKMKAVDKLFDRLQMNAQSKVLQCERLSLLFMIEGMRYNIKRNMDKLGIIK
jgi:hypothetical protein